MQVSVRAQALSKARADWLVIPVAQLTAAPGGSKKPQRLPPAVAALDRACGGPIAALVARGDFAGKRGETAVLYPTGKATPARLLLRGLGEEKDLEGQRRRMAAGSAVKRVRGKRATTVALAMPKVRRITPAAVAQALCEGAVLGAYRFDRYKQQKPDSPSGPRSVTLLFEGGELRAVRQAVHDGQILADAQNLARDLSNEPANELPPVKLASAARAVARRTGLRCRVLDVKQMEKLEMGAILAVGQGSANPPRMIVMEHVPKRKTRKTPTVCLVGKGITFDTGGISIKPSGNMHEMKHDMSGAAAVVGAMQAVGKLALPIHVVGVIAAAENMPGGRAYRPGDVVRSMSGKTIEILNTDAEGRVVLADALHYARSEFRPDAMVDLATLTGACVVALGRWATGVFSRDDGLAAALVQAGQTTGETTWRMPLFDEHERAMKSTVGDLKNAGARDAGASTAAGFLAAFAGDGPWAHLDIAGTAWGSKADGCNVAGATGVGVRMLLEWLRTRS
ncbi:MAG: leucyl aminopeptidase [Myxococcota bacterium]|nr:leucyl aminopeptidase [Myxococcota bacterium]